MSSSEIIFQEVKHRRKFLINQHPVILEPNIRKKFQLFFGNWIKIFIMCSKDKILRSRFLPFLNDFRFAWATIMALCSQGLRKPLYSWWLVASLVTHCKSILTFVHFLLNIQRAKFRMYSSLDCQRSEILKKMS